MPEKKRTKARPASWKLVTVYFLVCVIWGTTWVSMKFAVETIPPITAAGLRFTAAFPLLVALVRATPHATLTAKGKNWLIILVAILYIGIPYALINYGEQHVSSGLASLLFASVTVFLLLFSRLLSGTRITALQSLGVGLGICLLVMLTFFTSQTLSAQSLLPPLAILVAALLHAFTYAMLAKYGSEIPVLTTEALPVGIGGLGLLALGLTIERPDFTRITTSSWLAVGYLALVASVLGIAAYFFLLKHLHPLTVSYVFVIFPVIATFVSTLAEGMHLSGWAYAIAAAMLGAFALTKAGSDQPQQGSTVVGIGDPQSASDLFTAKILTQLRTEAAAAYPEECCGFIVNSQVRPATNEAALRHRVDPIAFPRNASTSYVMSIDDTLYLDSSMGTDSPVRALYHSHPNGEAYFSDEDERRATYRGEALYPNLLHVVLGVTAEGIQEARVFIFDGHSHREILDLTHHKLSATLTQPLLRRKPCHD